MNQSVYNVQVGQVYEDLDKRRRGRTFRVESILNNGKVLVKGISSSTKMTKISLNRFKTWKYKLKSRFNAKKFVTQNQKDNVTLSKMTLADQCKLTIPCNWVNDTENTASVSSGDLKVVVVKRNSFMSYDITVLYNNQFLDSWSSEHIMLSVVLSYLFDNLISMRDDFSAIIE